MPTTLPVSVSACSDWQRVGYISRSSPALAQVIGMSPAVFEGVLSAHPFIYRTAHILTVHE